MSTNKPPYRVPMMAEIAALPRCGYKVVSTFSGAGGSCLGFRMAGFETVWASEFVPEAVKVYRLNYPGVPLNTQDIREVTAEQVLEEAGLQQGEADVLEGSPPCASFSTAGRREASWGKVVKYSSTRQRVDDLFFEFARIVEGVQPRIFVAENVSGLVKGKAKGYFKEILACLKNCGYAVRAKLLDAQWLGVPQHRERLFFLGVRNDFDIAPIFPVPLKYRYYTSDACEMIRYVKHSGMPNNWKRANQYTHPTLTQTLTSITAYLSGGEWIKENDDAEPRRMTIDEQKRIQSFPCDFKLSDTFEQQWERIARTVPPIMMWHVAREVRGLLEELDDRESWLYDPLCLVETLGKVKEQ